MLAIIVKVLLLQIVVIGLIIFILKKVLDRKLIDGAISKLEFWSVPDGDHAKFDSPFDQTSSVPNAAIPLTTVAVTSYSNLNQQDKGRIQKAAVKNFGSMVKLSFQTDRGLLGGMIIALNNQQIKFDLKERLRQAFSR